MLKPRKMIDPVVTRARLDGIVATLRRAMEDSAADPFDEAMMSAVVGIAGAMKGDADEVEAVRGRMVRLARQTRQ